MWIRKKDIELLSEAVRGYARGQKEDIRDNKEGAFSILKNDIYALADRKDEQLKQIETERDILTEYMADISHQLKTPITSMMIMADLLEEVEPEKQTEFIRNIKISLSKMEWLVSGLLKMAKLDSKAVTFHKRKVKVSDMMQTVLTSVAILLDIHDQTIKIVNEHEICCDRKWTEEALVNLIKNAIEYSPNGSEILVDCGENPIYEWISVTDCGQGMKKEQYAALFKRFEYSTNENGYGIGMPLALSIMKGQDGDIDVDFGGNGKGATFTMKLYK